MTRPGLNLWATSWRQNERMTHAVYRLLHEGLGGMLVYGCAAILATASPLLAHG